MKRAGRAVRRLGIVVLCGAVLAGCRDSGLPGKNLPQRTAQERQFRYPAYQPTADNAPVALAGRHWIGALPVESIPDRLLTPIGSDGGQTLYALRGRQPPYSRLYARVGDGRWRPYVRLN